MSIRRAIPVVVTDDPAGTRAFYEDFLGFRVGMQQDGFLMLVSPSEPTTQVIVAWEHPSAMDPSV
jgi:catechol 2,3-dioxygenase-like lactoylglutathione lyase family enzyme